MDLALNNLQRLMCHKTQTTNQLIISFTFLFLFVLVWGQYSPCDLVAKVLDSNIVVSKLEPRSRQYVPLRNNILGKDMNLHIPYGNVLNSIATFKGMALALNNPCRRVWH